MDCDSDDIQTLLQGFWESQDATICNQYGINWNNPNSVYLKKPNHTQ